MDMSVGTLLSVEDYLNTSYSPDMEYRDGVLVERNVGEKEHARLQALLTRYLGNHEEEWNVVVYTELRVRVREKWYPIPDVCIYRGEFEGRYPSEPPLLWIEILSPEDRMSRVWKRADELIQNGVPYIWIIDPETLESELRTASGAQKISEKTLRLPDSPIVIPLREVWKRRS
jgi:Uma2 family endonuclease